MAKTKRCSRCEEEKPLEEFYRANKFYGDGRYCYCKPCQKVVNKAIRIHTKKQRCRRENLYERNLAEMIARGVITPG